MEEKLPLSGYRVADFGWVWAGTLLGSILGSYGAEVIKIESKKRIDGMRFGKVFELGEGLEKNTFFQNLNRNKLSANLNISTEQGVKLFKDLVRKCDIVIENFSPGTLEHRGLDYQNIIKIKPDIIMLSLSPMGQFGPLSRLDTYAPIISALSGIDSMVGYTGESPIGFKHAYADVVASMCGLFAVLAALRHHSKTGEGQYIDLSQGEAVMPAMGAAFIEYEMNGRITGTQGNSSKIMAPHGIYSCMGNDQWVSIAVKTEEEWQNLCYIIEKPEWAKESRFDNVEKRIALQKELDDQISKWTTKLDKYEVAKNLQNKGIAAAPVLTTEGLFLDPGMNERKVFVEVDHPINGNTVLYNWPWKISPIDKNKRMRHAPILGESNSYVFKDILGLTEEEIQKFIADEVIY